MAWADTINGRLNIINCSLPLFYNTCLTPIDNVFDIDDIDNFSYTPIIFDFTESTVYPVSIEIVVNKRPSSEFVVKGAKYTAPNVSVQKEWTTIPFFKTEYRI